jgi:uncharacterized protein (TIGR02266 family)
MIVGACTARQRLWWPLPPLGRPPCTLLDTLPSGLIEKRPVTTSAEQRRHARKAVSVEFRGKDAGGEGELSLVGADLSAGGTFLRSDVLLEPGETLSLEFHLPGASASLQAQVRVAWVRRFPDGEAPAGMGIEFLAMPETDRRLLETALGAR